MRLTNLARISALAVLSAACALSLHAQQDPKQQPTTDPVADAARKARAQQKADSKPKKVYTDDDFASTSKAAASSDTKTKSQNGGADQADADKDKKDNANGEEYWRKRFAKAHEKLATSEKELDLLQRELDKSEVQYYPDPQKAMMQQNSRSEINDKRAKIDAKQKEIEGLKQQLSDMEDELRKAGGDSGWAR